MSVIYLVLVPNHLAHKYLHIYNLYDMFLFIVYILFFLIYVRNTLASCEAYDVYTASMPNSVHKDAIYGHGRESKEYLIHLIFRYQPNPETGLAYGHYNFLMPTKGEDASASSDTKIIKIQKLPVTEERHTTQENIHNFFEKCKDHQSKATINPPKQTGPPKAPADKDTTQANVDAMFAKCIDHQNKVAKKAPVCEPVMKQVVERDTTQKNIDALFAAFPGANVGPPPVPPSNSSHKICADEPAAHGLQDGHEATKHAGAESPPLPPPDSTPNQSDDESAAHGLQDGHEATKHAGAESPPLPPPDSTPNQSDDELAEHGLDQIHDRCDDQCGVEATKDASAEPATTHTSAEPPPPSPTVSVHDRCDDERAVHDLPAEHDATKHARAEPSPIPPTVSVHHQRDDEPNAHDHQAEPETTPMTEIQIEMEKKVILGDSHGNNYGDSHGKEGDPGRATMSLASSPLQASGTGSQEQDQTPTDVEYARVKSIVDRISNFQRSSGSNLTSESEDEQAEANGSFEAEQVENNSISCDEAIPEDEDTKSNGIAEDEETPIKNAELAPAVSSHDMDSAEVETTTHDTDTMVSVLRLPGPECERILATLKSPHDVVMVWCSRKILGEVYLIKGMESVVLGKASVEDQHRVSSFAELRKLRCFKDATPDLRTLWKNRVLHEEKQLYVWKIVGIELFDKPLYLHGCRFPKHCRIDLKNLKPAVDVELPGLDLQETALYFLNRLGEQDLQRLQDTMQHLDNCVIRVGTACSGTDIAVSVLKSTMAAFSKHFNVSWLSEFD